MIKVSNFEECQNTACRDCVYFGNLTDREKQSNISYVYCTIRNRLDDRSRHHSLIIDILNEVEFAEKHYDEFHSPHEGYAIISEELDELWDQVKKHNHCYKAMYDESVQIACTAIRFMKMCKRFNPEVGDNHNGNK